MWHKTLCALIITCLHMPAASAADHSVVYLVRHAEKILHEGKDPELTRKGLQRAKLYADMFRDAGITGLYSTDYKRTQATVEPLATLLKQSVTSYNPNKLNELANTLRDEPGVYFVSGHSNTTPDLVIALGGNAGNEINEEQEFDRVYQVIINADGTVYTHRLRSLPK